MHAASGSRTTGLAARPGAILAAALLLAGFLVVVAGTSAPPLSRSCAPGLDAVACEGAVSAVMRRGLPGLHPLILGARVEPGSAPRSSDFGHRATVTFDLLAPVGPVAIELHFDQGAHWGGTMERDPASLAAWALAPLLLSALVAAGLVGLPWWRSREAGGSRQA